jgi:tRNA G18 (ribose-2'-O)-methylase SpoU
MARADRIPVIGMLDNIRSLYNVGSIFRSSDGAAVQGLYLCGYTPHPPRKEIEKTALGSTQTVPWKYFTDPRDAILEARSLGMKVCVLEHTTRSIPYHALSHAALPLCLVVGNELTGIAPAIIENADLAIDIPMYGSKQSLNAAVAYGVAVFELARLWRQGKGALTAPGDRTRG